MAREREGVSRATIFLHPSVALMGVRGAHYGASVFIVFIVCTAHANLFGRVF
jgi:hypothetical protein